MCKETFLLILRGEALKTDTGVLTADSVFIGLLLVTGT